MNRGTIVDSGVPTRFAPRTKGIRAREEVKLPLSLTWIAISIILPEELSFYIFGLRFTATRLLFIVLAPLLVFRLSQKVASGRYRFLNSDLFVVLSGFWMIYAPANLFGIVEALNHGGPIALEFCVGYFSTRVLLSEHGQALEFASLFCRLIAIAGLLAGLDTLAGHFVIHDLAAAVTGYHKDWQVDYRFGLLRAAGPFEHPILLGMLSGIGLIISSAVHMRWRAFVAVGCSVGAIFAFSSAPIQSICIAFCLLGYNRVFQRWSMKWFILISACALAAGALMLSGHSLIGFVISHLIYDPVSGYYRYWTWQMVSAAVQHSPWFGLGFGPYPPELEISHTVDALWLVLALNFGEPGAIFVGLSLVGAAALPVSKAHFDLSDDEKRLGLVFGIIIFVVLFISFTTDFWGATWITTAVLAGVKAHLSELGRIGPSPGRTRRLSKKQNRRLRRGDSRFSGAKNAGTGVLLSNCRLNANPQIDRPM